MARVSDLHKKWMKEPRYRRAYAALEREFALASAAIEARGRAGLTQEALARRMGTTQPVVARLESGGGHPSIRTLDRLAKATGSSLMIGFRPVAPVSTHLLTAKYARSGGYWGRYGAPRPPQRAVQLGAA